MKKFLFLLFTVFTSYGLYGQGSYDSIVRSNVLPIKGIGAFFNTQSKNHYTLFYKNNKLLKIKGKLASQSKRKAILEYVQENVYTLRNYYNQSHSYTIDTICFLEDKFMISNSQYSFSARDTIGRFIVYCDLSKTGMEGKIYCIKHNFSFLKYCTSQEHTIKNPDLVYHFLIYKKGEYLNKKVLKKLHEYKGTETNITDYTLGKKEYSFYNIPLLIIW